MRRVRRDTGVSMPAVRRGTNPAALSALSIVVGIALWQALAAQVSGFILPSPWSVLSSLADPGFLARLLPAFGSFLLSMLVGFAISLAIAIPLGIALGRSERLRRMFEPGITAIYAIPPVAFVPFLVVWFGLFFEARVALVVLMTVFDVLLVVIAGARDVRSGLIDVGRSFGASRGARLRLIVLPAVAPFLLSGLRVGIARAINGTITAELFFAAVNMGRLIKRASQNFDTATVLLIVLLVSILGLFSQWLIGWIERRFMPWHAKG
jgi:ABC-type nitrate/sulfonate/bicarbonate transport system permease component